MARIDAEQLDKRSAYALITSALVPRPIAWVGTRSAEGVDNLAPFSYFMGVSSEPPLLAISVARGRGGALKDTARNLLERREATVCVVDEAHLEDMHRSSAPFAPEVSEFDAIGLTRAQGERVSAPRVDGAPVCFECVLHDALDLGSTHLLLLRVVCVHVRDELLHQGTVRFEGLHPVARLGGSYALLGEERHLPVATVEWATKPPAKET